MDASIIWSFVLGAGLAVGCGGAGKDSIPACDNALREIEAACGDADLSDIAKKTCANAKKSIGTMVETGLKTGQAEIAADGCRKQAEGIEKMTRRAAGKKPAGAVAASKAAPDKPDADGRSGADAASAECKKMRDDVEAACADEAGLSASGKAICKATRKVTDTFSKMAVKNASAAQTGCKKARADWAKKGGLKRMVGG